MKLDDKVIEEIRNKVNIVDVISSYINVIKKGNNYVAVCPFHNDTNPSMNISVDKQIYKCFSCGAGGNAFTFVSEYEKIGFIDAVKKVADIAHYDLSEYNLKETKTKEDPRKAKLLKLVEECRNYYNYTLLNTDNPGKTYLTNRGVSEEIINHFHIGYASEDSTKILKYLTKKGYTVDEIIDAGIGVNNGSFMDRFNGRVIFPITDMNGNVVAFSGRRISDEKPNKYVNSNENLLFKKSDCLYNFYEAKSYILQTKTVYIVEGFMDAIALYKAGVKNVVATMGVALSSSHIKALEKMKAKVVLSLDGDEAGQSSMFKLVEDFKDSSLTVRVTTSSKDGKDLDEIYNKKGEDGIKEFLNNTYTINEFKLEYKLARTNLDNYIERSELIKYVANIVSKEIPDRIEKESFIELASKRIGCNKELISENVDNLKRKVVKSLGIVQTRNNNNRYYLTEIEILKEMLFSKDATYYYIKHLGYLMDSVNRSIATYIVNYYYTETEWDGKKIINSIVEEDVKKAALKIYNDDGIAKKFNKSVFDVIIKEKPLDVRYKELQEKFENEYDQKEKARIKSEMFQIKQQLRECKENIKEDN